MGRTSSSIYKRLPGYGGATSRDAKYIGHRRNSGFSDHMKKLIRCDKRAAKRKEEKLALRDISEERESEVKETAAEERKLNAEIETQMFDLYGMYDLESDCPLCLEADCERDRLPPVTSAFDFDDDDSFFDDMY